MIQSMIDWIVHIVSTTPPWVVYLLVWSLVFVEGGFFIGLILPGETALLAGAVACAIGPTNIGWLIFGSCVAAIAGDYLGYRLGRRAGPRITETRLVRLIGDHRWHRAEDAIRRGGATAVLTARWVGYARSVTPFLAGVSGMRTRTFLLGDVTGCISYVVTVGILGYAVGASVGAHILLYGALGLCVAAILYFAVRWWVHSTRRRTG